MCTYKTSLKADKEDRGWGCYLTVSSRRTAAGPHGRDHSHRGSTLRLAVITSGNAHGKPREATGSYGKPREAAQTEREATASRGKPRRANARWGHAGARAGGRAGVRATQRTLRAPAAQRWK